ncbi:Chondroitin AC/alginate lyase [Cordyceps fumosorosea ARSEF 2679]|uniref:Chondroitin AC/alginate lyase n=1 Tax=Cordyceps fumosorosea (strain ARSEF 2679) TaxID=1081104 RepID=A0A167P845_CORFA|nr:Chondroitin AC/alginate lyase [Cordyceps fumosorosea ARSEF 2679]OAA56386.1 Chondroitin AC/alginate lyase [Cordyceps fumosorosea ARSEF 2679]
MGNSRQSVVPHQGQQTWVHPGVFMDKDQLHFMKHKVSKGEQPWLGAYNVMMSDPLASLTRKAAPVPMVQCGSYSNPDVGCSDERKDSIAAYAMSLAWYITGQKEYAHKAIEYMNAWSAVVKDHNNTNAPLQSAWVGSTWARAAEIIRHTSGCWDDAGVQNFEAMLKNVYLPKVIPGAGTWNGNWELVMMEAAIMISVFVEDPTSYDKAMTKFLARVPAYIYMRSDGDFPVPPANTSIFTKESVIKYWYNQTTFVDGLSQETCRDLEHTGYGVASISHVAETSRIQGRDLFVEDMGARLRATMEFHAQYALGAPAPSWLCGGKLTGQLKNVTEVGNSELVLRLGKSMPQTKSYTLKQRPGGENGLFVLWETLTHGRV